MIRLSIIVPFYNVEQYIEECIRSLYDQDIPQEEYEVICVDDCSPDGSRAIVERLQKEYKTLRLICHERNKKLGGARNTGLKEAKGQYVWFVDSDDQVYPNVFKVLLEQAEINRLDILQFDQSRGGYRFRIQENQSEIQEGEAYLFEDGNEYWYFKVLGAWRQMFRCEFLRKNQIWYIEDAMYEDTDCLLHAFIKAKRVQYVPLLAYYYRVNEESVSYDRVSPAKVAWRVNLTVRCRRNIDIVKTPIAKEVLGTMIYQSLTRHRPEVKELPLTKRLEYVKGLLPEISKCRKYVNWRTWLAIRYGITMFI